MKKQKFMTRIIFALTLATMIAIPTATLRAQSSDEPTTAQTTAQGGGILDVLEQIKQAQAQRLEGTWRIQLSEEQNCQPGTSAPSAQSLNTFARGGSLVATPNRPGITLLGVWQHTGGRSFTTTMVGFRFNPNGTYAGTVKVTRTIEIGEGFDEFTSDDSFEFFDANDNSILKGCGSGIGRRLK